MVLQKCGHCSGGAGGGEDRYKEQDPTDVLVV